MLFFSENWRRRKQKFKFIHVFHLCHRLSVCPRRWPRKNNKTFQIRAWNRFVYAIRCFPNSSRLAFNKKKIFNIFNVAAKTSNDIQLNFYHWSYQTQQHHRSLQISSPSTTYRLPSQIFQSGDNKTRYHPPPPAPHRRPRRCGSSRRAGPTRSARRPWSRCAVGFAGADGANRLASTMLA